ncbi:hypothetical protein CANCADRAFT_108250 [Tortispora caseinolytica NRRL Y-17796]|uniref:DNA polymerase epsilon subunit B n=1 Tax=Tortispora caseinolytica NRRL Y-17796 TaxID=767744 RepID=A0A1E4TFQ3_9ASCO|nr:hypothetical protein CANCADRAFT_108250 [Tortispora caseinolytica NRRL Y-17796]
MRNHTYTTTTRDQTRIQISAKMDQTARLSVTPHLPVELKPSQLRPLAYRVLSKKHGLNLKSTGLDVLAAYIGRAFGSDWNTRAEKFLDFLARQWKEQDRGLFIDGNALKPVIQEVELRHDSIYGAVGTQQQESLSLDDFFKVLDAFSQPLWTYNAPKKHFDLFPRTPSALGNRQSLVEMFLTRYHMIYHRLSRSDFFQTPSSEAVLTHSKGTIYSISHLLGRYGKTFLLFGLLSKGADGNTYLHDPSGRILLDLSQVQSSLGYYHYGCFVLVEGLYSSSETFIAGVIAHPPAERRYASLDAYDYIDFLGVTNNGSRNTIGRFDRSLQQKMFTEELEQTDIKIVILGHEIHLDNPKVLLALDKTFAKLDSDKEEIPLAIVLIGSFTSSAFQGSGDSTQYKASFDNLEKILKKYPDLTQNATFIFVPGENDPWATSHSSGAIRMLPQRPIPEIFTNRLRRVSPRIIFTSNPCRISFFSQEIVICRDDIGARMRRNQLRIGANPLGYQEAEQADKENRPANPEKEDNEMLSATDHSQHNDQFKPTAEVIEGRRIARTLLDQATLSPFPQEITPNLWDYYSTLWLQPLPTVLVMSDATSPSYIVSYEECQVSNVGSFLGRHKVQWCEYRPSVKEVSRNSLMV